MDPITPAREGFILPDGTEDVTLAENQKPYRPLPVLRTPNGRSVSQWRPTAEELAALLDGQPITLVQWTFNQKPMPVFLGVGGFDLTGP